MLSDDPGNCCRIVSDDGFWGVKSGTDCLPPINPRGKFSLLCCGKNRVSKDFESSLFTGISLNLSVFGFGLILESSPCRDLDYDKLLFSCLFLSGILLIF